MDTSRPITSWAEDDRPREKLALKGKHSLSDAELIAILIGSGTRKQSAVELSKEILQSCDGRINDLGKMNMDELMRFNGIGEAKAISIIAALELGRRRKAEEMPTKSQVKSSRDAYEALAPHIADLGHEEFMILLMNRNNQIMGFERISSGGVAGTVVDPKIIFKRALDKKASSIILAHNHPSGNLKPSSQDIKLTKSLVASGALLDLPILDHLIITEQGFFSFADEGMLS